MKDTCRLLEEIRIKALALIGIMVDVNLKTDSGREYLLVVIAPYDNPISYKGEFHYRSGSACQVLRGVALNRFLLKKCFLLKKHGRTWDDEPLPGVGIKGSIGCTLEECRRRAAAGERLTRDILQAADSRVRDAGNGNPAAGGQAGGQAALAARDTAMLRACVHGEASGDELLSAAGYARHTGDFRKRLAELLHADLLEMTVPDRPRSPLQKYRLTSKGRSAVAALTRPSVTP